MDGAGVVCEVREVVWGSAADVGGSSMGVGGGFEGYGMGDSIGRGVFLAIERNATEGYHREGCFQRFLEQLRQEKSR